MKEKKEISTYTQKRFNEKLEKSSKLFTLLGLVLSLFIVFVFIEFETKKIKVALLEPSELDSNSDYIMSEVFTKEALPEKKEQQKAAQEIVAKQVEFLDEMTTVDDDEPLPETLIVDPEESSVVAIDSIVEVDIVAPIIEEFPFKVIENVPVFPGCKGSQEELRNCFSKKINKHVSRKFNGGLGQELGLSSGEQRIFVMFKIDRAGAISDIQIRAPHPRLQKEADRVVRTLPKMTPGKQRGRPVAVRYSIPIRFLVE